MEIELEKEIRKKGASERKREKQRSQRPWKDLTI